MMRSGLNYLVLAAGLALAPAATAAVTTNAPDFKEIYGLVRSNLAGVTESQLDQAAVNGLVAGLDGRILLESDKPTNGIASPTLATHAQTLENGIGYVRVERVADGVATQLASAVRSLVATNELKGLILDLRFARGTDYAAAVAAANLFVARQVPLLNWGDGVVQSQAKTNAWTLPLAVLVNHDTTGAAEALAAMLRETGSGLLLGNTTAGRAMVMQDFPLKNGQHLRIASRTIKLGDGTELSAKGVKADIEVPVNARDESAWFEDPYDTLSPTNSATVVAGTNDVPRRPRMSEAELVRERRTGGSPDTDEPPSARPPEPQKPFIHDPVLARAIDLLKALALVRGPHN